MDRGDAHRLGGSITTVIGQSDAMQVPPTVRFERAQRFAQPVKRLELDDQRSGSGDAYADEWIGGRLRQSVSRLSCFTGKRDRYFRYILHRRGGGRSGRTVERKIERV